MATSPTYGVFPLYSSSGSVINTEEGVEIIIQGDSTALDQFKERLMGQPPALSDITDMRVETLPPPPPRTLKSFCKVVPRGAADKIFITTSGIGSIIVSGTMADHGMAILTQREGMRVSSDIISDSAPLNHLVRRMIESGAGITMLRDPTRGGLATILNEIASNSKMSIRIHDDAIPVKKEVVAVCELFGIDPLYVANEGKLVAVVREKDAEALLEVMRNDELGQDAAIIGEVLPLGITGVFMKTRIEGEQLPRIC